MVSRCCACAAVCVKQLPRMETESFTGQARAFLCQHVPELGLSMWDKQQQQQPMLFPSFANKTGHSGQQGRALFWKSLSDPRAQTFHWNPHPCAFTPAHACQRPVFMERGESQCPPVVSLHSAKKFQFLSSFTTHTAAFLYGTATKAPRMSENENQ